MKSHAYLLLPFLSTLINSLFAGVLIVRSSCSNAAQIPAVHESPPVLTEIVYIIDELGRQYETTDAGANAPSVTPKGDSNLSDLQWMPEYNFQAYVRRDVSTFYGEESGSRVEKKPDFTGQAGKFINMSDRRLDLYWDNDGKGQYIGNAGAFEATGTAVSPGHKFFFAPHGSPNEVVCRFIVSEETMVYFYDPFSNDEGEPGRCMTNEHLMRKETLTKSSLEAYNAHRLNLEFSKAYKEVTGGAEWLSMFPRDKPRHHIWATDEIGQTHHVQTQETQFVALPVDEELHRMDMNSLRRNVSDIIPLQDFRTEFSTMDITMTVVSCEPRILEIPHFLSDIEVDHILDVARRKNLIRSTTGNNANDIVADVDTRTSTNTWVSRYSSPIVDTVYRRIADLLKMDEALLRHRFPDEYPEIGTSEPISEDLQLVHYNVGEEYTAHHDFGYPERSHKNSPSRSINVLMYLNEGMKGGETSFPRWRNAETSGPLNVTPEKGKAVIFYMLTPDGNMDELTQHAALPVTDGEKWLANLWIHDPIKV